MLSGPLGIHQEDFPIEIQKGYFQTTGHLAGLRIRKTAGIKRSYAWAFFKGNYPDRCSIQAACLNASELTSEMIIWQSSGWQELLPEQKLEMDVEHHFTDQINAIGPISHIRLNIFPDGGVSRLRLIGTIAECER